jgi:beta-galactosidase
VELFINGVSQGVRSKQNDDLHVMWRVKFEPGVVKAVSRKGGREVLVREIRTAGEPITIRLKADRATIAANGNDLSFVTCELLDAQGNAHPLADKLVKFSITGEGFVAGTDNGNQNDHNSLKKSERHLFFGKCMAIVQSSGKAGKIVLKASLEGLPHQQIEITAQ